jgi:hypothetical protein
MASANTISLAPVEDGWAVMLIDGRELARFNGPDAKREALRYFDSFNPIRRPPPIDKVRSVCDRWRTRRPASSRG